MHEKVKFFNFLIFFIQKISLSDTNSNQKFNKNQPPPLATSNNKENQNVGTKKKTKYVAVNPSGDLEVTLLKGRHRCDCQASKHKLIRNCMNCGRIVCEQEGSGPCLFCGNLVVSREEQEILDAGNKRGEKLKKCLLEQGRPKGWEEALAQRNRLLDYDRNSARRTEVIDDESDYFKNNNVWLSDAEKKKLEALEKELQEKKHESRRQKTVTVDIFNRQIVEKPDDFEKFQERIYQEVLDLQNSSREEFILDYSEHVNVEIDFPVIEFSKSSKKHNPQGGFDGVYNRVQDKEILEMSDMKNCLSMHQPWASLLIAGIKKHEGRSWYTHTRGRLWIASTAKPVTKEDIEMMEKFYRQFYDDPQLEFPSQYPSGVLLGYVTLDDCLPQEEYQKVHPGGESDSPYVFICSNPQPLSILFPVKGEHKIYKLEPSIHLAACKSIVKLQNNKNIN